MAFKVEKVERKVSKRGRKVREMPAMAALVSAWNNKRPPFKQGETVLLPDGPVFDGTENGKMVHATMANYRHHFKKYASQQGLRAGIDYTIEFDPEHLRATITRLS